MNLDAGLPNITGETYEGTGGISRFVNSVEGAFSLVTNYKAAFRNKWNGESTFSVSNSYGHMRFDASRCSAVYGRSTTIQPASTTVNYFIRAK